MIFRSSANLNKSRIFPWWKILLFGGLFLATLYFLFPPALFLKSIETNPEPNQLTAVYLKNLIEKYPHNVDLKISLGEQELSEGHLPEAEKIINTYYTQTPKTDLEWKVFWLHYLLLRTKTYALENSDATRKVQEAQLAALIPAFLHSPVLTIDEITILADDALANDNSQLAVDLYKKAETLPNQKTIAFYEQAAKAALFAKSYQDSANFYLEAMGESTTLPQKKLFFMKAVDSIQEAGSASVALGFARKHVAGLEHDQDVLIYLAQLALSANDTQGAEGYIKEALKLEYRERRG